MKEKKVTSKKKQSLKNDIGKAPHALKSRDQNAATTNKTELRGMFSECTHRT